MRKRLTLLVFLSLVFAGLVLTNVIAVTKFRTVTYDNGEGGRYRLRFYARHSVKTFTQGSPSLPGASGVSAGLKVLASKIAAKDKYPLITFAETGKNIKSSDNNGAFAKDNCALNGLPKVFSVKVEYINTDVPVCAFQQYDTDLIYLATFHKGNNGYLIYFSQDVDFSKLLSNPAAAKAGLAKIGLQDYQPEVKTILSSIKPID